MTGFVDANILLRDCAGFRAFTSAQHCVKPARHCSKLSFAGSHQCTTGEGLTDTRRNRRAERACCPQALSSGWEAAVDSGTKGVRVFQMDHHPRKRIFAEVRVHASVEQVWRVITDYDHLADFVPNLIASKRLPITTPGRIHLQQLGCSQSVFWRLEAEAVLECVEIHKAMGAKELRFKAIEGDFKEYSGSWVVEPDPAAHTTTLLKYEISLEPKLSIPSAIVTCVVKAGLPANMMAMARRAEQVAEMKRKFPRFAASAIDDVELDSLPWQTAGAAPQEAVEQLPEAGPSRPICDAIGPSTQNQKMNSMGYLGMISVPLPHQRPEAAAESQEAALDTQAEATHAAAEPRWKLPSAPAPVGFWGRSPDLGVGWKCVSDASAVTEVHLRRLDEPDQLHRRVVAVLTVDATPEEVWKVLTDYERLPEVVPNLAVCERVQTPSGMSSRVTRLRQVGYKHMLYMSMHAEAVVDLVETKHKEVQFRQVQGDFSLLQGKFLLQEAESEKRFLDGRTVSRPQTHLKYAVEVQIPRDPLRLLGLVEPIIERMVYEDLPLNLGAIKQRVEEMKQRSKIVELEGQGEMQRAAALRRRLDSPPVAELQNDIASLVLELERCYGDLKRMPTRAELRGDNRGYLERAIAAHGGYGAVAGQIGWAMAYTPKRPRGYWNSITNVKSEVDDFIDANGLQPGIVPSLRDVRGADRCDLARAIEKWGGPSALAEDLAYGVAQRGARQSASKDTKASHSHGSQPDQTSILGSIDDDLDEQFSPTTQISATPAARARSIATTVNRESHRTHSRQPAPSRQQQDRSKIVSPLEVKAREKQPIVNNRRRIAIRRKTPKLPSMRQEMDEW
ncbi:TPA: hypothetical protein ACH3X3_010990 [Trebouxia sp. C0006]